MTDAWNHRLSEYLDEELTAAEAAAVSSHLQECERCRLDADGLKRVKAELGRSRPHTPPPAVWSHLAGELRNRRQRRQQHRWSDALGLAASLLVMSLLLIWARGSGGSRPALPAVDTSHDTTAAAPYAAAAASWRDFLARSSLPREVSETVEGELARFDAVIAETRAALQVTPDDPDLRQHLARTLRSQVRYLQRAGSSLERTGAIRPAGRS